MGGTAVSEVGVIGASLCVYECENSDAEKRRDSTTPCAGVDSAVCFLLGITDDRRPLSTVATL